MMMMMVVTESSPKMNHGRTWIVRDDVQSDTLLPTGKMLYVYVVKTKVSVT